MVRVRCAGSCEYGFLGVGSFLRGRVGVGGVWKVGVGVGGLGCLAHCWVLR